MVGAGDVMLPGGRALADMSWGRSEHRDGPTTGNIRARSSELGHFHLSFDGAGEITTSAELARRIVGAGRCVPLRFDIELAPAMPVWDLFKATEIGQREWGGTHHEQVHSATGWLMVAGPEGGKWRLDGARSGITRSGTGTSRASAVTTCSGLTSQGAVVPSRPC